MQLLHENASLRRLGSELNHQVFFHHLIRVIGLLGAPQALQPHVVLPVEPHHPGPVKLDPAGKLPVDQWIGPLDLPVGLLKMDVHRLRIDQAPNGKGQNLPLRPKQQAEQPQWEPVELCAFARTLCAEQNSIQQKLHIQLELDCGGLTELYVDADIGYLTTICLQLLSNALRACIPDGGHITLSVRARPEGGALFSVADDGCGLPDGTLRSQQNNRSRFLGTTKSGLLLCQAYCRLTGWTLELTARPGGSGTVARLTLPQREGFASSPTLRSVTPEDTLYAARQLWMALAAELACVPGMEGTPFQIPAELT